MNTESLPSHLGMHYIISMTQLRICSIAMKYYVLGLVLMLTLSCIAPKLKSPPSRRNARKQRRGYRSSSISRRSCCLPERYIPVWYDLQWVSIAYTASGLRYTGCGCGILGVGVGVVYWVWVWYTGCGCGILGVGVVYWVWVWVWYTGCGCGILGVGVVYWVWVWHTGCGCVVYWVWVWYTGCGCGILGVGVVYWVWVWYTGCGCGILGVGVTLGIVHPCRLWMNSKCSSQLARRRQREMIMK